jgi:colanic acid/amylovoran biosynthesis glycosyltransferase
MKTVLIYKTELLHLSETFIQAQAGHLKAFRPQFAGLQRAAKSLTLPGDVIFATSGNRQVSRLRSQLYRLFSIAPGFMSRLQATNPSLIHSHFATESVTALPIAERLNIPLIVTLHGADITVHDSALGGLGGRLYVRRREQLWRRTSLFICVSEFIKRKAMERGFPAEKLRVHYIGIDRSLFLPSTRQRKNDTVLFVGRLTEKKGCEYLLRAMALVQKKRPEAELTIMGDGPLRQSLEGLAKDLGIGCKFLGGQPSHVVRDCLESTRVFCVPSVTAANGDSEGLGMVFAEAQAMGVPVVSFAHGGIPEVVQNGSTGLLAPECDHVKLADSILRYLTDDTFWQESAVRGMDWIKKRFDIDTQTTELEEIYAQVISNFSPR